MEELKTCPFCGRKAKVKENFAFVKVVCDFCDCTGPLKHSREDAINAWNTRVKT